VPAAGEPSGGAQAQRSDADLDEAADVVGGLSPDPEGNEFDIN
jgi:hypothetical protein